MGRNPALNKKKADATSTNSIVLSRTLDDMNNKQTLKVISLGQGQGSVA